MKIELARKGGFTGIPRKFSFDLDHLETADRERLQAAVAAAGFFELPKLIPCPNASADQFHYVITIRAGERRHVVQASEPDIPEDLHDLIEQIIHQGREVKAH